jgi:hypothetical protein
MGNLARTQQPFVIIALTHCIIAENPITIKAGISESTTKLKHAGSLRIF